MKMLLVTLFLFCADVHAQAIPATVSSTSLPSAPVPQASSVQHSPNVPTKDRHEEYLYRIGYSCGVGATTSSVATKPTFGCGAGITFMPLPLFVEVGLMGPQANRSYLSGYVSVDANIPLWSTDHYGTQALVGYSRLFETGHALDYGFAIGLPRFGKKTNPGDTLRIELRDYWTFANPSQHNVMLRLGWMSVVSD